MPAQTARNSFSVVAAACSEGALGRGQRLCGGAAGGRRHGTGGGDAVVSASEVEQSEVRWCSAWSWGGVHVC